MNLSPYQTAFTAALRAGDEAAAREVVRQAQHDNVDMVAIYFDIFAPSMVTVGELWERNELTVAEEHLATAITEQLIGELSPAFRQRVQGNAPGGIILGCVEGERHELGVRMLADLFRKQGWRVLYLGADVPCGDWVRLAVRYQADAVAISAGARRHIPAVLRLIVELRGALPELVILVGGAVFDRSLELWREVGADLYDPDPLAAVARMTAPCQRSLDVRVRPVQNDRESNAIPTDH